MGKTEETKFICPPTGAAFMRSNAFTRGILGPFGSGKSSICCMEIMRRAMEMPPSRDGIRHSKWAAVRNTNSQLLDTTLKTWLEWFPIDVYGNFNKNDMIHYVRIKNEKGEEIHLDLLFRALDKPQDTGKLKSLDLTGIWLNEAVEMPVDILQISETRVGRYPARRQVKDFYHGVIMDTNPPDNDHWWFKMAEEFVPNIKRVNDKHYPTWFDVLKDIERYSKNILTFDSVETEEEAEEEAMIALRKYAFWKQPSGISPQAENIDNLPKGYYRRMMVNRTEEWIKVYVHGEYGFVSDGKAVYPEYRDSTHFNPNLLGPDEDNKTILRGWDGGRTPACTFMQLTPDGRLHVFDEECGEDIGLSGFADVINKKCASLYPGFKFVDYGDPSIFFKSQLDDRVPKLVLAAKGIQLHGGIQSPKIRKEALKKLLTDTVDGQPAFQVGPNCSMLRKGMMGGYCFKRKQTTGERYHDVPDKNKFSHVVEALEYPCTRMFGRSVLEEEFDYKEVNKDIEDFDFDAEEIEQGQNPVTGY